MAGQGRDAPFITVVTPVYNGARFLGDALACLAAQEPVDGGFEILATDDGSTDGSRGILREARRSGLPVRLLEGAHRHNWVASTNKALALARGEWIVFLHQDDRYSPIRLQRLQRATAAYPDAAFLVNDTTFIGLSGSPLGHWDAPLPEGRVAVAEALPPLLVQNNFSVPGVMFRRRLLEQIGYLDEELRYTADWDFWLRIIARHGVVHLRERLSEFRIHPASQTVADFARHSQVMRADLETVVNRYASPLNTLVPTRSAAKWRRLARLGIEVDLFLAAKGAGGALPWRDLARASFRCRPWEIVPYLIYSKTFARVSARLKAGLSGGPGSRKGR